MVKLTSKDSKFREEALNGPIWPLLVKIGFPLAIFQALTQFFNILDTLMASHISSEAVSTVVYFVQINHIVGAIGGGLAVGGSIKISHSYGAGRFEDVKRNLSTLIAMTTIIGGFILLLIPFIPKILQVANTPESFIQMGSSYFALTLFGVVINFFNTVYIAIEKARGNTKTILKLNMTMILIKLSLTAFFVYVMDGTIIHIAIATLISYVILFAIAIHNLLSRDDAFTFSAKYISLKKETCLPILRLSFPSMCEKMAFSYGKALVNQMASNYGTTAVGASGISNNMSGALTGWQIGFQDGGTALVGQVYGAKNLDRTIKIYRRAQILELIVGTIGITIMFILMKPIAMFFSLSRGGLDYEFQSMIINVFSYEILGCFFLSFFYSSMSFILGTGRTKLVFLINFLRIFIFRVPLMWYFLHFTDIGFTSIGMTTAISNSAVGIFALIMAELAIKAEKKKAKEAERVC